MNCHNTFLVKTFIFLNYPRLLDDIFYKTNVKNI